MLSFLAHVKPAWCALLNVMINIITPQHWTLFRAKLVDTCNSFCYVCENISLNNNNNNNNTGVLTEHVQACGLPALECFRLMEQAEINVASRAVSVVDIVYACTSLPCVLSRLSASYELDSSLCYTARTIEAGYSISRMFS